MDRRRAGLQQGRRRHCGGDEDEPGDHRDRSRLAGDIDAEIEKNADLARRQRERAAGALMGPIMAKYRGQVSGQELSALLAERLKLWLERNA